MRAIPPNIIFRLFFGGFVLWFLGASCEAADTGALRKQAFDLFDKNNFVEATPLLERLIKEFPNDTEALERLGFSLMANTAAETNAGARKKLRLRAREMMLRSQKLGNNSHLLQVVLESVPPDGSESEHPFSKSEAADFALREGEAAFVKGEFDKALAAYDRALSLDPSCYEGALFTGDVYFKMKKYDDAGKWFDRATLIKPDRETAYRYWGDTLMMQGKMREAREKFIEAIIANPYERRPWFGLAQWAEINKVKVGHPEINVPMVVRENGSIQFLVERGFFKDEDGTKCWALYGMSRQAWRKELFAKENPDAKEYRHSLREEVYALTAVANGLVDGLDTGKIRIRDRSLSNLFMVWENRMVEPYVLFARANKDIAQDYKTYREKNREKLKSYLTDFFIHDQPNAPQPAADLPPVFAPLVEAERLLGLMTNPNVSYKRLSDDKVLERFAENYGTAVKLLNEKDHPDFGWTEKGVRPERARALAMLVRMWRIVAKEWSELQDGKHDSVITITKPQPRKNADGTVNAEEKKQIESWDK